MSSLKTENESLKKRVSELQQSLEKKRSEIYDLETKNKSLNDHVNKMKQIQKTLEQDRQNDREMIDKLTEKIKCLDVKIIKKERNL